MSVWDLIPVAWMAAGYVVWRPTFRATVEGLRIGQLTLTDVIMGAVLTTALCAVGGPLTLAVHLLRVGAGSPEGMARTIGGESRDEKTLRLEQRIRDLERETGVAR